MKLTKMETTVYELLCEGLSVKEIADKLFLGQDTIRTHKARIFKKKGIHSIRELLQAKIQELKIEAQFFKDYMKITNEVYK